MTERGLGSRYVLLRGSRTKLRDAGRRFLGRSTNWWDHQDRAELSSEFLRTVEEGTGHPSRRWVRSWLTEHPNLSLLDIPCGPGVEYEGISLASVPVKYTGMDQSETMLDIVRSQFPGLDLRRGDITAIPLPDSSMDVVLCRHILEHLEDFRPAVAEAVRVAREYAIFVLFRIPSHSEVKELGYGAWDNRIDLAQILAQLQGLGVSYTTERIPYGYPVPLWMEENTVIVASKLS